MKANYWILYKDGLSLADDDYMSPRQKHLNMNKFELIHCTICTGNRKRLNSAIKRVTGK